jgi:hypothetical protein
MGIFNHSPYINFMNKNHLFLFFLMLCVNTAYTTLPADFLKIPAERHQIRLTDQATNKQAGIIDFDVYRSKNGLYATGGTFYVEKEYRGKVSTQKIFQDWLLKLPELGVKKAYWRADPFEVDAQGNFVFYHNNLARFNKGLAKLIPWYTAIGGKPEQDAHGKIIQTGHSTSQGMKSVRFSYIVPGKVLDQTISSMAKLKALFNIRTVHTVYVKTKSQ